MRAIHVSFVLLQDEQRQIACTSKQQSDTDGKLRFLANGGLVRLTSSSFPEIVQRLHRHGDRMNWTDYYLYKSNSNERDASSNLDARGQMAAAQPITLRMPRLALSALLTEKQRPASSVGV
jgi:hypothetical protein